MKRSLGRTPRVLVAHPGTQYAFSLARQLDQRGLLFRFWTCFAIAENSSWGQLAAYLPSRVRRRLATRLALGLGGDRVRTQLLLEWRFRGSQRRASEESALFERNRRFQEGIPREEIAAADVIVGFDTSSWILARRARSLGKRFVLDQSIGHPAAKELVFRGMRQRFPEWSSSIPSKSEALIEVEREEHARADRIVAPSSFVKRTLMAEGVEEAAIEVVPFGTDLERFRLPADGERRTDAEGPAFLFVGTLTVRKGLPVLLEAWRSLISPGSAELWLVGPGEIPSEVRQHLSTSIRLFGPQSRESVAALMRRANVFVFPSYFEGLAQVQLEALASGLPVIGTPQSGAAEVVVDGENGFIVEAGDTDGLRSALQCLIDDPNNRRRMQGAAAATRQQLGWDGYGKKWEQMLRSLPRRA